MESDLGKIRMNLTLKADARRPGLKLNQPTRPQPLPPITRALRPWWGAGLLLPMLSGCAQSGRSPEIDVLGSYWPSWMICIIAGLILTSLARLVFIRLRIDGHLRPAPLVYFCLIAVFTFVLWLLIFNR
jgi:hypothetical protein